MGWEKVKWTFTAIDELRKKEGEERNIRKWLRMRWGMEIWCWETRN
jgi:hypothetical protein